MSNLLEKASILLTPTGYDNGSMNCIKPNTSVGDFDFTRGSAATRVTKDGLIKNVQILSGELVQNGDFATDTDWVVGAGWTIENGKANIDTSGGSGNFNQLGVLTIGKKYRLSLSAAMTVGRVKFQSDAAGVFIFSSDVSSHEFIASSTSVSFRRFDTTTSGYIDNVSIIEITDDTNLPRIDYSPYTGAGTCGHWLLEPQSTNTATYSNDFSQGTNFNSGGRTLGDSVLSANQGTAPDGTNTAQKLTDNNNGGTGAITLDSFGAGLTSGQDSTVSIFVKKDTVRYFTITFTNFDSTQQTGFDLDTGNILNSGSNTGPGIMTNYGNGWYRCSATFSTTTDLVGALIFAISNSSTSNGGNLRDGSNSTFLWGYQAEESSFATSYIPTVASTVTRNGDFANSAGDTSLISSTQGVLYAEIAALADDSIARSIALSSGDRTNTVEIFYGTSTNQISFKMRANNSNVTVQNRTVSDRTQFAKVAIKYKSGDIEFFINGVKEVDRTDSFTFSSSLSELAFDRGDGADEFEGKIKSVAVFKEALTDSELTCLTS